jgi:hypothetical protein
MRKLIVCVDASGSGDLTVSISASKTNLAVRSIEFCQCKFDKDDIGIAMR